MKTKQAARQWWINHTKEKQMALKAEDNQALYWKGPLSRAEAQNIFDQYGTEIQNMRRAIFGNFNEEGKLVNDGVSQVIFKLDLALAYIMTVLNIKPEDLVAWATEQAKKAEEAQKAAQEAAEQAAKAQEGIAEVTPAPEVVSSEPVSA